MRRLISLSLALVAITAPAQIVKSGWTMTNSPVAARAALGIYETNAAAYNVTNHVYLTNIYDFEGNPSNYTTIEALGVASNLIPRVTFSSLSGTNQGTLYFYGDSLTSGTGGTPYPSQLAASLGIPSTRLVNLGVAGVTAEYVYTNGFLPNSNNWGNPAIFWMGNNDNGENSNNITPYVSNIVARLTTTNYLFASIVAQTNSSVAVSTATTNFNRWLSNYVGAAHYVDFRSALAAATNGSATDALWRDSGWTPHSLLVDQIHLNTNGYGVVANAVKQTAFLDLNRPPTKAMVMELIPQTEIYLSALDGKGNAGADATMGNMYPDFYPNTSNPAFPVAAGSTYAGLRYTIPTAQLAGKTNIQISMLVVTTNSTTVNYSFALYGMRDDGLRDVTYSVGANFLAGQTGLTNTTWIHGATAGYPTTNGLTGLSLGMGSTAPTNKLFIIGFRVRAY